MSMITITNSNNKYFKSQDVRVFPCSYRGYYNNGPTTLVFDPEARATTESNFTEAFHKLSLNKESYIVNWDATNGVLKCVIGGYYFEIHDCEIENFFWENRGSMTPYYLCIQTKEVQLGTSEPDERDSRKTHVLSSFDELTDYLDVKYNETDYAFTGLLISTTAQGTANFQPFKATAVNGGETITYTYSIDNTQLPITNILDSGEGSYSVRMINNTIDPETKKINTTKATGDSSIALGKGTKATAEAATATGDHTEANAKGAFSGGVKTKASAAGAVALGNNTHAKAINSLVVGSNLTADKENQVVFGQYNTKDENQAFIIANGTGPSDTTANKFTVGYEGNIRALGNLEIKGSIKATGSSTNDLELGTTENNSSGSIKVYGTDASEVFSVANSGNTSIEGTASISGNTTIAGITELINETESSNATSGALRVKGGVGIRKNLNVGGALTVGSTLTVGNNKSTTLGGTLTVKNNTNLQGTLTTTGVTALNDTLTVEKLTTLKAGANITGNLSATGKVTSAETTAADTDNTLTTKNYVDSAEAAAKTYTDDKIKGLDVAAPNVATDDAGNEGDGSYLKTITQTDGKIAATKVNFATTFGTINNLNAPTTSATDTHLRAVISNLWTDALVKKPNNTTDKFSLQALILDAVYPVGSIYMQYVASTAAVPGDCPLASTLTNSSWELIENGRFLRAVGETYNDRGKTGGTADAGIIAHTHGYNGAGSATAAKAGSHSHSVSFRASKTGTGDWTGFEGNAGDKDKGSVTSATSTTGEHSHTITVNLPPIGSVSAATGITVSTNGEGRNLPPYLNVYMWRRTQ